MAAFNLRREVAELARRAQEEGYSLGDLLTAVTDEACKTYCPEITHGELLALKAPFQKSSTQAIEALEADSLMMQLGWELKKGRKTHISFDPVPVRTNQRNTNTFYVQSAQSIVALVRGVEENVFLNLTRNNFGYDLVYFRNLNIDARTLDVVIIQLKIGLTKIGCGLTQENANRSMPQIANKLHQSATAIRALMLAKFRARATVHLELHTTSAMTEAARRVAIDRGIRVYDADQLWEQVWMDDVKVALEGLYGERDGRYMARR